MYGLNELKPKIIVQNNFVECPIKGCLSKVNRQSKVFKTELRFQCPVHRIYISPSTFEYESQNENLLWTDNDDIELLSRISKVKREDRMARDNSEDALTWNVFRFIDKQNLLIDFLRGLSNKIIKKAELMFWSFSPMENAGWSLLNKARKEFGETVARGSEPDVIIVTDSVLYFIEAKFTTKNVTRPKRITKKKYEFGGDRLFQKILKTDFETIAMKEGRYEFMRFWILGNWISTQLGLDFEYCGLVLESSEPNLKLEFEKHIIKPSKSEFYRLTWEQIFYYIMQTKDSEEKLVMINYFKNKTIGYNSNNTVIKAFSI